MPVSQLTQYMFSIDFLLFTTKFVSWQTVLSSKIESNMLALA